MTIHIGSIVRYKTEYCHTAQMDYDLANSLGLVKRIIPSYNPTLPAIAEVLWDDGEVNRSLVRNLETYLGSIPLVTKRDWSMLEKVTS